MTVKRTNLINFFKIFLILGMLTSPSVLITFASNVGVVSNSHYIDTAGNYHIVGEVNNVGSSACNYIQIRASLFDNKNIFIDTKLGTTLLDTLLPGRKSPFDIPVLNTTTSGIVDHFTLSITYVNGGSKPLGLDVISVSSHADEMSQRHVTGTIKNSGSDVADNVKVVATFYNSQGVVIANSYTYIDSVDESSSLNSGASKSFDISLDAERSAFASSYTVTAESTNYAISSEISKSVNESSPTLVKLDVRVIGSGSTDLPSSVMIIKNSLATVTATPAQNWTFAGWLLDGVDIKSSLNPFSLMMDRNHVLSAVFIQRVLHNLNLEVKGSGSLDQPLGNSTHDENSILRLVATPSQGWRLSGWRLDGEDTGSNNTYTLVMDMDHSLVAVFTKITHVLRLGVVGSGSVDQPLGNTTLQDGSLVDVTATPSQGWLIGDWRIDGKSSGLRNETYSVTLDHDHTIIVVFVEKTSIQPRISNLWPPDGAKDVSVSSKTMNFTLTDPESGLLDCYISVEPSGYTAKAFGLKSGNYSFALPTLDYSTSYVCKLSVRNNLVWSNSTFSFTTNEKPNILANPTFIAAVAVLGIGLVIGVIFISRRHVNT